MQVRERGSTAMRPRGGQKGRERQLTRETGVLPVMIHHHLDSITTNPNPDNKHSDSFLASIIRPRLTSRWNQSCGHLTTPASVSVSSLAKPRTSGRPTPWNRSSGINARYLTSRSGRWWRLVTAQNHNNIHHSTSLSVVGASATAQRSLPGPQTAGPTC